MHSDRQVHTPEWIALKLGISRARRADVDMAQPDANFFETESDWDTAATPTRQQT